MAQKSIEMSIIRQVLTGRKKGKSTREMAMMYHLSRSTIQRYVKMAVEAAIRFFGGAPDTIVPDNLRSAASKVGRWASTVTGGMADLASHYGCNVYLQQREMRGHTYAFIRKGRLYL